MLLEVENVMINIRDHDNYTALHHACIRGHQNVVTMLLDKGADVNAVSAQGETPLHAAALMGRFFIVKSLLQKGANINIADHRGYTALMFAIREGHEDVVKLLLNYEASVYCRTVDGFTPLHIACCRRNLSIVKLIGDITSDVNLLTMKKQVKKIDKSLFSNLIEGRFTFCLYVWKHQHCALFAFKRSESTKHRRAQLDSCTLC